MLLTTMNNVGSTTVLRPVFNNLEQVITFGRVNVCFILFFIRFIFFYEGGPEEEIGDPPPPSPLTPDLEWLEMKNINATIK